MKKLMIVAASLTAMATATLIGGSASAQVVTTSYTFTSIVSGDTANPFNGSFSLSNNAGKYSLSALSATYRSGIFTLANSGLLQYSSTDLLIGGNITGINGISSMTNDFALEFNPVTSLQVADGFNLVSNVNTSSFTDYKAALVPVTVAPIVSSAVPEPASWAMMIAGFGLAGGAMRRRKSAVTTRVSYAV